MRNNIDDFFKDGLTQHEFEYKEETWEGFKELYESEKEDDPVVVPFINKSLLIGGLMVAALIGLLYATSNQALNNSNITTTNTNSIIANSPKKAIIPTNSNKKVSKIKNDGGHSTKTILPVVNEVENKSALKDQTTSEKASQKVTQQPPSKPVTNVRQQTITSENPVAKHNSTASPNTGASDVKSKINNVIVNSSKIQEYQVRSTTPTFKRQTTEVIAISDDNKNITNFGLIPTLTIGLLNNGFPNYLDENFRQEYKRKTIGKFFLMGSWGIGNIESQNVEIGLGKRFVLNKHIGFNVGAKYKYILATNLTYHRGFSLKYNRIDQVFFGEHIKADKIHIAALPISTEFSLRRHRLHIGATYNRLLFVKGTIEHQIKGEEIRRESHEAWIVETGLNLDLISANVGYGFRVDPSSEVFINAEMFLTDLYNNESTTGVSHKFNNINVGLKYFLNPLKNNQTFRLL